MQISAPLKSRLAEASRHPLVLTLVGFICTGILGGLLTYWLNSLAQIQERERSTRNNAIASVTDISELLAERRVRGTLVVSSIRRGAPESEIVGRKNGYDKTYIRW